MCSKDSEVTLRALLVRDPSPKPKLLIVEFSKQSSKFYFDAPDMLNPLSLGNTTIEAISQLRSASMERLEK